MAQRFSQNVIGGPNATPAQASAIRQEIRGRLRGPIKLVTSIDTTAFTKIQTEILDAMTKAGREALVQLGRTGASMLNRLYASAGRRNLGDKWTNSPVQKNPDGSLETTIFNKAMDEKYQTRSNAPGSNRTFPISGRRLLTILEEGARPHKIFPRNARALAFRGRDGVAQSRFAGAALTERGVVIGKFRRNTKGDQGIFTTKGVTHPGIVGSRFVSLTANTLAGLVGGVQTSD